VNIGLSLFQFFVCVKQNATYELTPHGKEMGSSEATADAGGKDRCTSRACGYQYMTPSYVEDVDEAASYPVIANALLENSSAHGLPTFYRAQGESTKIVMSQNSYT